MKIEVNQTMYLIEYDYRGSKKETQAVKVSKVGRKYFELEGKPYNRYDIKTLREVKDHVYKNQCYLSIQEIEDDRELNRLTNEISQFFRYRTKLTIEQLREISKIINTPNQ